MLSLATQVCFSEKSTWMIACECHSLQLPIIVDMLLLSLFLCSHVGNWGRMEMIYCCKWLVVQSSSTLHSLLVSSFRQTYHVAAFSSCKVSAYLVRKHQPPQHTVHSLSNSQQWHSHTRKSVLMVLATCRDIHVLCVAVYCFSKLIVF